MEHDPHTGTEIEVCHVRQQRQVQHQRAVRAGDWRRVEFTFADPHTEDGKPCRVVLLRPAEHVTAQGWCEGGEVEIDFGEEVRRENGSARIVSITAAAEPEHGAGQVVTGTFQTWHRDLRELWMEGLDEPVRVTSGHRFFSASRAAWIEAHHLQVGETVRTRDGSGCRVLAVKPLAGEHAVFNIEVETLHQYHVTTAGLLTHNNKKCDTSASAKGTVQANEAAADAATEGGQAAAKTTGEHSAVLRKNLEADGRPVLPDEDAAHIVASGHPRHAEARAILDRAGIGVDDAINGGGLPSNTKVPNPLAKTTHSVTHRHKKMDQVTRELRQAEQDGTVHDTLRDIESRRQSGKF